MQKIFMIPIEDLEKLKEAAERLGKSESAIIREAVKEKLEGLYLGKRG